MLDTCIAHDARPRISRTWARAAGALKCSLVGPSRRGTRHGGNGMMSDNAPFGVMLVTFDSIVLTCAQIMRSAQSLYRVLEVAVAELTSRARPAKEREESRISSALSRRLQRRQNGLRLKVCPSRVASF